MIKNVAEHIGVTASCINYWEANSSSPEVSYLAAIIDFLGWNLLPPAAGIGDLVVRQRTRFGLTRRQAARIELDPTRSEWWGRANRKLTM